MRLEMVIRMQIEIPNGGEILVNCEFKLNQNLDLNLYREIQGNSNRIKINSTLYREIPRNLNFSILTCWLKSPHHSGFLFAFRWPFRVSCSRELAVFCWVLMCNDLIFVGKLTHLLCVINMHIQQPSCRVSKFMKWMNRFVYYNFDRFTCVHIPAQIKIQIATQIWTVLRIHVHSFVHTLRV